MSVHESCRISVCSNHPILLQTVAEYIHGECILGDESRFCSGSVPVCKAHPEILIVDTHSTTLWHEIVRRWYAPGRKTVALVSRVGQVGGIELELVYLGVKGIIGLSLKELSCLPQVISRVEKGELWISRCVLTQYVNRVNGLLRNLHSMDSHLTSREREVFNLLKAGLSNREIGNALGFSERTAKFHVSNILQKANVKTRRDFERGWHANGAPVGP